jgi:hypothetical protein
MNIAITPDATLANNAAALAAFDRAAADWSGRFTNDITINISAGLSSSFTDPHIIGNTSAVKFQSPYDFFRGWLQSSAAKDPNDGIVAAVPDLAHFSAALPTGISFSGAFITTKANFKALGFGSVIDLDKTYGANDATITFNSNFSFDYDNRNGVDADKIDFQSVAAHEIGHALGFLSQVDAVDILKNSGATNASIPIAPLDLFRFQNNVAGKDPGTTAEFTNDPRYLDTGGLAIFDELTLERLLSTGRLTGDGLEASHWKDDAITGQLLGIMDPSMNFGVMESISAADIRALDLIGYDVPEPGLILPLAMTVMLRRQRKGRISVCPLTKPRTPPAA